MKELNFLNSINSKISKLATQQDRARQEKDESFIKWLEKEHAKFNDPNAKSYGWLASLIEMPSK